MALSVRSCGRLVRACGRAGILAGSVALLLAGASAMGSMPPGGGSSTVSTDDGSSGGGSSTTVVAYDFNGDAGAKPDVIVRAPAYNPLSPSLGSVSVWFGGGGGYTLSSGAPNDLFGFSSGSAGDLNGDGFDDLAVGAPLGAGGAGVVYFYSGTNGASLGSMTGAGNSQSGFTVAGLGKLGGTTPMIAYGAFDPAVTTGTAGQVKVRALGSGAAAATLSSGVLNDGFGSFIKAFGDVNGDGVNDVAVGAVQGKKLYVYSGAALLSGGAAPLMALQVEECVIDVIAIGTTIDVATYTVTAEGAAVIGHTQFGSTGKQMSFTSTSGVRPGGDADMDFVVNADDVGMVQAAMGTTVTNASPFSGDLDGNGFVDGNDLAIAVDGASHGDAMTGSAALTNQYREMVDTRVAYFDFTATADMSAAEKRVQVAQKKCKDCPKGQSRDCRNICCGPGSWQDKVNNSSKNPTGSSTGYYDIVNGFGFVVGHVSATHSTSADPAAGSGSASVQGDAGNGWSIFSYTWSGSANCSISWNYSRTNRWVGTGPVCARPVHLAASGGGSEAVSVTCGANASCVASAGASGSASCASLGNASADMTMHSISLDAAYNSATSKVDISGNAAGSVTDNQASVKGQYSASGSWSTTGTGSKSGSASYSVAAGRTYNNDCTASGYTITHAGSVAATGGETVGAPGSASFSASSQATLRVN